MKNYGFVFALQYNKQEKITDVEISDMLSENEDKENYALEIFETVFKTSGDRLYKFSLG